MLVTVIFRLMNRSLKKTVLKYNEFAFSLFVKFDNRVRMPKKCVVLAITVHQLH